MQVFLLARIIDYQSLQKHTLTEIFNIDDFFIGKVIISFVLNLKVLLKYLFLCVIKLYCFYICIFIYNYRIKIYKFSQNKILIKNE